MHQATNLSLLHRQWHSQNFFSGVILYCIALTKLSVEKTRNEQCYSDKKTQPNSKYKCISMAYNFLFHIIYVAPRNCKTILGYFLD